MKRREISHEEFVEILGNIVAEEGRNILSVPGVYEVLSEEYNNEVLEIWEEQESVRIQDEQTRIERDRGY